MMGLSLAAAGCDCDDQPPISQLRGRLAIDPLELDFGDVPLGAVKGLMVKATNTGEDTLRFCITEGAIAECREVSGIDPSSSPYQIAWGPLEDGGLHLVTAAEHELIIRFQPTTEGTFEATARFAHDGGNPTVAIRLVGRGVQPRIEVNPSSIDFGEVTVDQQVFVDVTLTNANAFPQPVTIGPVSQASSIFGTASLGMELTPDGQPYEIQVPPQGSTTFKAWFRPVEEGEVMNVIPVSYCPSCNADISVRGVGVRPQILLEPSALDFGDLDEGQSNTLTFVAKNVGNAGLTISSFTLTGATPPHYTITPQLAGGEMLPIVLDAPEAGGLLCAASKRCEITVSVTYTAATPGSANGAIAVASNAWAPAGTDNTAFVQLLAQSNGPDIRALPRNVNFGTVGIGGAPVNKNLLVENAGNRDLAITDIRLASPTAEITMVLPGGQTARTLTGGDSFTIQLSYAPTNAGADQAFVEIDSNDADEPNLRVQVDGFGGVPTACSVAVAPTQVTFGLVERGRVATLPVEVRNGGAQPCAVTNLRLTGDASFSMAAGTNPSFTVQPGQVQRIDLRYGPTAYGNHSTILEFDVDDPAQPNVQVPVNGASAESRLLVVPSSLDFNVVPVTCGSPNRAITVYNTGGTAIQLRSIYLDSSTTSEFELQALSPALPHNLAGGASYSINLRYRPQQIGSDTGLLLIEHSESAVPLAVPLSGRGEINAVVTDTFQQLPTPAADILFVIDDSCSMEDEQAALGPQLDSFLSYANTQGVDYQIAVTTTDVDNSGPTRRGGSYCPYNGGKRGQFVECDGQRIITRSTANAATLFNRIVTSLGSNGSGYEQGLEAAYLALSDPTINTWNAGFLRPDAALAVILVSDEEDFSTRAVTFYSDFFKNIKGFQNQGLFSFSSVIVLPTQNPSCSSGGASRGIRYAQVTQQTGGVTESICTANWGQTLANIGLNTFGLKRKFFLSSQPVPTTVSVTINGSAVPSVSPGGQTNWSYDQATNSIEFTAAAIPQAGSTVAVTYTVACLP